MFERESIIVGPIDVQGLVLRVVELDDGSGRVEIWDGSHWSPGGGDMISRSLCARTGRHS